ncbi:MAG: methyltransferase domain-containing protein [Mariniblastus sp.]
MPEYRDIYNHVVATDQRYNLAENSPGLRAVIKATDQLSMISGRSLDVGCGVGFVLEYLSGREFDLNPFGVDISDQAIEKAKARLARFGGSHQRLHAVTSQNLPFEDNYFSLVTCFDMLEHLDVADIEMTLAEIERVLRPGGVFFGSVSCRTSGVEDQFGDNLHRTVMSPDWWIGKVSPDRAEYDGHRVQLGLWKHLPMISVKPSNQLQEKKSENGSTDSQHSNSGLENPQMAALAVGAGIVASQPVSSGEPLDHHPKDSASLYQKIYDDNPWYGDADQGRCPGVRLLPEYQDWLIGPVMDLGCGRGQTVERLRKSGLEADGIDQIEINPDMRVGDITKPIEGIGNYSSVVCVDCIEHLYEEQVLGLFANMKQVKRQAFSIHNGSSTGTGQELHVNRLSFPEWTKLIREHFDIASAIKITEEQMLYLTQAKTT